MRVNKVLLASGIIIFAIFFFDAFSRGDRVGVIDGRTGLQAFELFGAVVSLYLLSRGGSNNATLLDWLACAFTIVVASIGFAGFAITLFALYLFLRDRDDLNTKAAGTVAAAVAVQAVWAPLIFSKISFVLLQVDAGAVGWLVSFLVRNQNLWAVRVVSQSFISITVLGDAFNAA